MSGNDAMEVTPNPSEKSEPSTSTGAITNATQSQIAQKTWEISNYIQGILLIKFSKISRLNK